MPAMTIVLILLIAGFAIAAATALIRGLVAFTRDAADLRGDAHPTPSQPFGVQQNRMMTQRVMFQGIAILLIVVVATLAGRT